MKGSFFLQKLVILRSIIVLKPFFVYLVCTERTPVVISIKSMLDKK